MKSWKVYKKELLKKPGVRKEYEKMKPKRGSYKESKAIQRKKMEEGREFFRDMIEKHGGIVNWGLEILNYPLGLKETPSRKKKLAARARKERRERKNEI